MPSAEAAPLLQMYAGLEAKVKELDEVLDAASDQKGAGRRAVINQLVTNNQSQVDSIVAQFVAALAETPPEEKFGVYFGTLRGLRNEFDEPGLAYAESLVEEKPQVQVDPAEVTAANEERSTKVGMMKNLKAILDAVDKEAAAGLKVPRRRSTGGPRGKRAISYYTVWTVDGVEFEGNINELAKSLGYVRPADLRDEMKKADPAINLTKPPDTINFTTSGGNVLVSTKNADAPNWEELPDEESDEDDDEDETEAEETSELANV